MNTKKKDDLLYWLWLMSLTEIGTGTKYLLLDHFKSPEAIFQADAAEYDIIQGLKEKAKGILTAAKNLQKAEKAAKYLEKHHIALITSDSADYPEKLRQIYHPPVGIFAKGNLNLLKQPVSIGIVGSRKASPGGVYQAEFFSRELGNAGITIISGLARGIDAAAHKAAVQTPGSTIAVLGCGINICYPANHKALYKKIADDGLIVTEFFLDEAPQVYHFPLRNRIISGLSEGVLVVESAKKSGALITARHAMEQGKNVYAIPKEITQIQGEGNNNLLKDGAKLVTSARDILEDYIYLPKDRIIPKALESADEIDLSSEERSLVDWIARGYDTIDRLEMVSGMEIGALNALLSMMELKEILSVTYGRIQLLRLIGNE